MTCGVSTDPRVAAARPDFEAVDVARLRRRRTVKWTLYGPDVLAAWVAEMDFDVAPEVRAALSDAIDREDFGYVEGDLSELTTACASFLASAFDWDVSPARVFPVADVLSGIAGALDLHVAPGSAVVVPTPAYPPFFEVVELTGRPALRVPFVTAADGRATLDLGAIDDALRRGARAVLLCNPHNPTGRAFVLDELRALARIVAKHDARVVADEVHGALVHPGFRHVPYATVSPEAADHAVTVTSASKAWNLAGLKCAQVIASNHADAVVWRTRPVFQVPGPSPLGVAASTAAYRDAGAWRDALVRHLAANAARLAALLADRMPGVVLHPPEATFLA
jgi:cysteine-S-conjugate beta-lyase